MDQFHHALTEAWTSGAWRQLTLGAPLGSPETLRKVRCRPVTLSAGPAVQLVWRHAERDVTENLSSDEALAKVRDLLGETFGSAHLSTAERTLHLERRGDRWVMSRGPGAGDVPTPRSHDRKKTRAVPLDPRWLRRLGVLDGQDRPKRGMHAKLRQIHRFVELIAPLLPEPSSGTVRLVDMGCGKGYLTFAAWELLKDRGLNPDVVGIEVRPQLASGAEAIARDLGCDGLRFVAGTIATAPLDQVDVVVALHACDTATDDALARGVAAGAAVLVVAPCCHKEIRPQLEGTDAVLRHGILRARSADMITDALRASLLEGVGYRARVVEFISPDHTDKNLMIIADRPRPAVDGAAEPARALARTHGIRHQRLAAHLDIAW